MKKYVFTILLSTLALISFAPNIPRSQIEFQEKQAKLKEVQLELKKGILIKAISFFESRHNPNAINIAENAVGILQIRPIMVREVNRILGDNVYTLRDRFNVSKSIEMFLIVQNYYNPNFNYEIAARIWNGGGNGMKISKTLKYWKEIEKQIKKING